MKNFKLGAITILTLVSLMGLQTQSVHVEAENANTTQSSVLGSREATKRDLEAELEEYKTNIEELKQKSEVVKKDIANIEIKHKDLDNKAKSLSEREKQLSKKLADLKAEKTRREEEAIKAAEEAAKQAKLAEQQAQQVAQQAQQVTEQQVAEQTSQSNNTGYSTGVVLGNGNTAGEYGYAAAEVARRTGTSAGQWEYIIAKESNGDPNAYNASGASGLFQTKDEFWGPSGTVEQQIDAAVKAYNSSGFSAWGM